MDLGQVTLAQMRYAVAVADARNFRAAAAEAHVAQSGLSMQIKKLEDLLGVALFDRSKKPVLITPEGERLIGQMRRVLRETERLGQVAAESDEPAGPYRLGVIPTLSPTVLPAFLATFIERYPRVELTIEELQTEDLIARLTSDVLDAGIASTPLGAPGLHETVLGYESLLAYLPEGDPLLRKRAIAQSDLEAEQLWVLPEGHCFRNQVLSYCRADHDVRPGPVRFESGSFQTLIRLVDGGLGATVLPSLVVDGLPADRRRAQARPLVLPTPVREIGLVTARDQMRRRVTDALASVIREQLAPRLGTKPRRPKVLDPLA